MGGKKSNRRTSTWHTSHLYSAWGPGKGGNEGQKEACIVALFFFLLHLLSTNRGIPFGCAFEHGQGRGRKADSRPAQLVGKLSAGQAAASSKQASSILPRCRW